LLLVKDKEAKLRDISKNILDDFEKHYLKIKIPILDKVLKEIFSENEKIDKILFIATDQEIIGHNNTDTVYCAEIIRKYVQKKYPQKYINDVNFQKVPISQKAFTIQLINLSPHDYDSMLEFYSKKLLKFKNELGSSDFNIYVSVTSGIQAMNLGLILSSIEIFEGNCNLIYSSESDKRANLLNLPLKISNSVKVKEFKILINNHQYYSASLLLDDINLDENKKLLLKALNEYSYNRYCFNFEEAANSLKKPITNSTGDLRQKLKMLQNDVCELNEEWYLKEIIFNSEIKLKNAEYIDFLGRIFRFLEAVAIPLIKKYGVILNEKDRLSKDWLKENHKIQSSLNEYFQNKYHVDFDCTKTINRESCIAILEAISEHTAGLVDILNKIKKLSQLADIRNQSIIAHGFKGISKKTLDNCFGQDILNIPEIQLDIYYFIVEEDISYSNPFDNLNSLILQNLE